MKKNFLPIIFCFLFVAFSCKNDKKETKVNTISSCEKFIGKWITNKNGKYPDGLIEFKKISEDRIILSWSKNDIGDINVDCECSDGIIKAKNVPLLGEPLFIMDNNTFKLRGDKYFKK